MAALCLSTQVYADKIQASTTLPSNGKPEHVYTMVSGNGAYVSPTTTPVEGDAENGLFAFYAVSRQLVSSVAHSMQQSCGVLYPSLYVQE